LFVIFLLYNVDKLLWIIKL